jgi:hypothetical protein
MAEEQTLTTLPPDLPPTPLNKILMAVGWTIQLKKEGQPQPEQPVYASASAPLESEDK